MPINRTDRLNSLLKEVISDIIKKRVKNPLVNELITVTRVDITKDLKTAKVFVSVIGDEKVKNETLGALSSAAGFIAVNASKEVVMRYFPTLHFYLDDSVDKHMRIEEVLKKIKDEESHRVKESAPVEDADESTSN